MSKEITWLDPIAQSDLVTTPVALSDPNVVDVATASDVIISGVFDGGTDVSADIVVFFYNAVSGEFKRSGIVRTLRPAQNLKVLNPTGLILGFTATVHGDPVSFNLYVGSR